MAMALAGSRSQSQSDNSRGDGGDENVVDDEDGRHHHRRRTANSPNVEKAFEILESIQSRVDTELFRTQLSVESKVYRHKDMMKGLRLMHDEGVAGQHLYLGPEGGRDLGWEYGLVNVAGFLAQSMKETIMYDACDENNWDVVDSQYPLSNACGQLGQSYQDYHCSPEEAHMECEVDPNQSLTATTHAQWYGAPPALFCGPKSEYPHTGFWDYTYWCDNPWDDPPEACDLYPGQKAGGFNNEEPVNNLNGRTDVEGCCWWGRGVIQSTGVCNYGKLNYYLGKRAADDGRDARYPKIDFCKDPSVICSSETHKELRWIAGLFYWVNEVQSYNVDGWYYIRELHKFVDNGMIDTGFIDAISGIVNRGCHNPPCATGDVDGKADRRGNFQNVLSTLSLSPAGARPPSTLPPIPPPSKSDDPASIEIENNLPGTGPGTDMSRLTSLRQTLEVLKENKDGIERKVLKYQREDGLWELSNVYTFDGLLESMTSAYNLRFSGKSLYLGGDAITDNDSALRYGLVNIAAFLAQSMTESIQFNACEEGHRQTIEGKYPLSNSCGQYGKSYQDDNCPVGERGMECPVQSSMKLKAGRTGKFEDVPQFFCSPTTENPFTGAFDPFGATVLNELPFPNEAGRTDVEGCCWWGRGALLTKGVCNMGKLNMYVGKGAADEGRESRYPDIDFCNHPEDICEKSDKYPNLVWDVALFEWVDRVQSYESDKWGSYLDNLRAFADGGYEDSEFIIKVSRIVATGSDEGEDDPLWGQRWSSFETILRQLKLKEYLSTPKYLSTPATSGGNCRSAHHFTFLLVILCAGLGLGIHILW